jgi:hypothetical protein
MQATHTRGAAAAPPHLLGQQLLEVARELLGALLGERRWRALLLRQRRVRLFSVTRFYVLQREGGLVIFDLFPACPSTKNWRYTKIDRLSTTRQCALFS